MPAGVNVLTKLQGEAEGQRHQETRCELGTRSTWSMLERDRL